MYLHLLPLYSRVLALLSRISPKQSKAPFPWSHSRKSFVWLFRSFNPTHSLPLPEPKRKKEKNNPLAPSSFPTVFLVSSKQPTCPSTLPAYFIYTFHFHPCSLAKILASFLNPIKSNQQPALQHTLLAPCNSHHQTTAISQPPPPPPPLPITTPHSTATTTTNK
jgi:hypothetical protein